MQLLLFLYRNNRDKIPEEIESRIKVSDAFSSIMEVLKCSLLFMAQKNLGN